MNDDARTGTGTRYGHFALPEDSSDIVAWVRQHGQAHGFELDASQSAALEVLQGVYEDLIALERLEASLIRLLARKQTVRGAYLWGGVGRGKSFLMDSFFNFKKPNIFYVQNQPLSWIMEQGQKKRILI